MTEVNYARIEGLDVHPALVAVVKNEVCEGTEISTGKFWSSFETLLREFTAKNESLLRKRDAIQAQIDAFHLERAGREWDAAEYASFLANIGYITPEVPEFSC